MTGQNNSQRRRHAKALARSNAQLAKNKCWDELNAIYNTCAQTLVQHLMISELSTDRELHNFLSDPATVIANIRSLGADLRQLDSELKMIAAQHTGKSGGASNEDEMMQAFKISEQYYLFMERHNGVVLPTVYHILEHFQQAELRREEARTQVQAKVNTALAQDPNVNVPIDVQVKPVVEAGVAAHVDVSRMPAPQNLQ